VKNARGALKSYPIDLLEKKFRACLKDSREIWLTAQDCGCYGFDIGTNLVALVKRLLECRGDFRVRVGMMNPGHLQKFLPQYLGLFRDKRLYRFFHLPVQSGSNVVLRAMNRPYTRQQFLRIAKGIRSAFPDASISLDAIVGFPGETEAQFLETVSLVRAVEPDVVNISRFGARPNTLAAAMPGQLHGRVKKQRSRVLTTVCREIALGRNRRFVDEEQEIFVCEKGPKGGFVGRNQGYKPVVVKKAALGEFATAKIVKAFPTYLLGVPAGKKPKRRRNGPAAKQGF
jgi:MiaB/RimO family radical SAM methylthiotransferase